jgi:16S rRNA (guanine966-N2)-methyltransferase
MKNNPVSQLRLIGGRAKGRKIEFRGAPGLRPTPDRLRETLFNWLQMPILDACCLDLFAGSGALGIEALSRGARWVDFVEADASVAGCITENLTRLGWQAQAQVYSQLFQPDWSGVGTALYDVVFLDPPYQAGLLLPALTWLKVSGRLAADALVYVECEAVDQALLDSLEGYEWLKQKHTQRIAYGLLRVRP